MPHPADTADHVLAAAIAAPAALGFLAHALTGPRGRVRRRAQAALEASLTRPLRPVTIRPPRQDPAPLLDWNRDTATGHVRLIHRETTSSPLDPRPLPH